MASLNKVILLGNLTRDPELRYAPNGTPVTRFGLAVNTSRAGQGDERKEEVCFVDIVAFGRQAETASEYLSKGRPYGAHASGPRHGAHTSRPLTGRGGDGFRPAS